MSLTQKRQAENLQNQYGLKIVSHLSGAGSDLSYDVSERLRAARVRAVSARKVAATQGAKQWALQSNGAAALLWGDEGPGFWQRLMASVPLVVLVMGLVGIHMAQNEIQAQEVAEIDSALLTDELPPAAYTDPGFAHFLRSGQDQP